MKLDFLIGYATRQQYSVQTRQPFTFVWNHRIKPMRIPYLFRGNVKKGEEAQIGPERKGIYFEIFIW